MKPEQMLQRQNFEENYLQDGEVPKFNLEVEPFCVLRNFNCG